MSIQDDIFDLDDLFEKLVKQDKKKYAPYQKAWQRVYGWGCEEEKDNMKLRPIVNKMKEAISLMFAENEDVQ